LIARTLGVAELERVHAARAARFLASGFTDGVADCERTVHFYRGQKMAYASLLAETTHFGDPDELVDGEPWLEVLDVLGGCALVDVLTGRAG
jgi:hypothetical protein